jgi:hypothetical protein
VLTRAHRRLHFDSSFTIVDVAGDDDFGDRVEAASAGSDEPCSLIGVEIGARRVVADAALMCVFDAKRFRVSAETNRCWITVIWTNDIAIVLRVYLSRD